MRSRFVARFLLLTSVAAAAALSSSIPFTVSTAHAEAVCPADAEQAVCLPAPQKRGPVRAADLAVPERLDSLPAVLRRAIAVHPQIGIARSRALEASAGLDAARAGLYPQLDVRIGGGQGVIGQSSGEVLGDKVYDRKNAAGSARVEGQVVLRQVVYDFGLTGSRIRSADARRSSSERGVLDTTEEVAYRMADAYLRVLESRETLAVSEENADALDRLRALVEENEKNGNSTTADVKRVQARLSDARTILAAAQAELENASDRFRRLVQIEPGPLRPAPLPRARLPRSVEDALPRLSERNPRLAVLEAGIEAARMEVAAQRSSDLPQISLDADFTSKSYHGRTRRDEIDGRALVTFRKNLFDGGLASSQLRQARERLEQAELQYRFARDEAEADLRQAYRAIMGARQKAEGLAVGVETSAKARELYDEQFAGGKRTLFELLDIQAAYYTARRSQIANRYEEHRSVFAVLRALGGLSAAVLEADSPEPRPAREKDRTARAAVPAATPAAAAPPR